MISYFIACAMCSCAPQTAGLQPKALHWESWEWLTFESKTEKPVLSGFEARVPLPSETTPMQTLSSPEAVLRC